MPAAGETSRVAQVRAALGRTARAVADAEPAKIEAAAKELGESRRYLAPVAWAAGTIVLVLRGIKLLLLNWRLTLIELVPALWVWVIVWDIKEHALRGTPFRQFTAGGLILVVALASVASVAAFWCNTVFAYAITRTRPRIRPAVAQVRPHLRSVFAAGTAIGLVLGLAAMAIPRIHSTWLYLLTLGAVYGLMLVVFVALPAALLGATRQRLPPKQAIGRWAAGLTLSMIAMTPGFVLDRVGLILIGIGRLQIQILGVILLSLGTALYAAGMSSVKAVKLRIKLDAVAESDDAIETA